MAQFKLHKSKFYAIVLLLAMGIVGYYRKHKAEEAKQDAESKIEYTRVELKGETMGTYYHIVYLDSIDYQTEIDSTLQAFNQIFSTYIPSSEISNWNTSDTLTSVSKELFSVIKRSELISTSTNGSFDPFMAPIFELWGFGGGNKKVPSKTEVDSVLQFSGFDKIEVNDSTIIKSDYRNRVNLNAIAKGYGCDVVGYFLESKGIINYKVEIGGEMTCKGTKKGTPWFIQIESPNSKKLGSNSYQKIAITDKGLATSGNYRNNFKENGKIYAHTLDPRTGQTANNNLLSVSVVAQDCMTADAYATGFMVMGFEEAKKIAEQENEIEAFFIYSDGSSMKDYATVGFKNLIMSENER